MYVLSPLLVGVELLLPELDGVGGLHAGRHGADAERRHQPLAWCRHACRHLTLTWLLTLVTGLFCENKKKPIN